MKIIVDLTAHESIAIKRQTLEVVIITLEENGQETIEIHTCIAQAAELHEALGMLGLTKSDINQPENKR